MKRPQPTMNGCQVYYVASQSLLSKKCPKTFKKASISPTVPSFINGPDDVNTQVGNKSATEIFPNVLQYLLPFE